MSYQTLEVELENGWVRPTGAEPLPSKARALLTVLELPDPEKKGDRVEGAGLRRFLSRPPLQLTQEQFKASMEADFWDQ